MSNPDDSAFPTAEERTEHNEMVRYATYGLSKREYMATQIAAGLCACPNYSHDVALGAVTITDRLLAELSTVR